MAVAGGMGLLALLAAATRLPAASPGIAPSVNPGVAAPIVGDAQPAAAVEPPRSSSAPRWIETGPQHRRRTGVNGFTFELTAENDVQVWRKRVRPVLTVRCVAKTTDVFVMTGAPAMVEQTTDHTVQISFDGREAASQKWPHSVDHDALFASDGSALLQQIIRARTMSFTFMPFNAPPAVVHFNVAGFETQVGSSAKKCGGGK